VVGAIIVWSETGRVDERAEPYSEAQKRPEPVRETKASFEPDSEFGFVWIPGGSFLMGAQASDPETPGYDPESRDDESPPRQVTLAGFWLQRMPVSAAAYVQCVKEARCPTPWTEGAMSTVDGDVAEEVSVNYVNWEEAQNYCSSIGAELPTEAEREYVARGESGRIFPWGDAPLCPRDKGVDTILGVGSFDNCDKLAGVIEKELGKDTLSRLQSLLQPVFSTSERNEICAKWARQPTPVLVNLAKQVLAENSAAPLRLDPPTSEGGVPGADALSNQPVDIFDCAFLQPPSPSDLIDPTSTGFGVDLLAGNVWEWTADFYAATRYAEGQNMNPVGPASGELRVIRGGGWRSSKISDFRAARREAKPPDTRLPDLGFRCARSE
jgi:formylglycine-generating enzyme required for sulfatase activity